MKSQIKNLDSIQIVGFIVSALVSIGLLVAGQDRVASVSLGFVLAALTQLFDLQKRQSDIEERLLQASALSKPLYSDEWLLEHVRQIVSDYQLVKGIWYKLFKLRADGAIIQCREELHGMAEGHLITPSARTGAGNPETFAEVKEIAKAVTSMDDAFWRSPEGDIYLRANADARRRKATIIRIFAYPLSTLRGMIDILETQRDLGIEVYIAPTETVPRELNEDYVILDNRIVVRTEQLGQQQQLRVSISKAEIEQKIRQFDILLRYSKRLEDAMDTLK